MFSTLVTSDAKSLPKDRFVFQRSPTILLPAMAPFSDETISKMTEAFARGAKSWQIAEELKVPYYRVSMKLLRELRNYLDMVPADNGSFRFGRYALNGEMEAKFINLQPNLLDGQANLEARRNKPGFVNTLIETLKP